ncbi:hypothetical protein SAMN05444392_10474 [Seinonella peptonophila]|uniref:Uncharacterized protein n=1 Tax=Seinonella peptonophila TaxID=112248 RepID=A0A1M4X1M7_9BACL|nr:hypothetical protein SAMN05444392_10474 [Seinonella peptonophila]
MPRAAPKGRHGTQQLMLGSGGSGGRGDDLALVVERPPGQAGEVRLTEGVGLVVPPVDRAQAPGHRHLHDQEAAVLRVDDDVEPAAADPDDGALDHLDVVDVGREELHPSALVGDLHRGAAVVPAALDLVADGPRHGSPPWARHQS